MEFNTARQLAEAGAMYLLRNINSNGKYDYQRDESGNILRGKYNLLRHFGASWAIYKVLGYGLFKIGLAKTVIKTVDWAIPSKLKSFRDYNNMPGFRGYINNKGYAKLGANALAAMTIHEIYTLSPNHPRVSFLRNLQIQLIKGMSTFISPSGSIIASKVDLNTFAKSDFVSEYYPGEAALCLASLGNTPLSLAIMHWVMETNETIIHDHWGLQALEKCYNSLKNLEGKSTIIHDPIREIDCVVKYANEIANTILSGSQLYMGNSCGMACRVEGLIAAYNITGDKSYLDYSEILLEELADKYICKDKNHPCYGALIKNGLYQIDYTQHAISAFHAYSKVKINPDDTPF